MKALNVVSKPTDSRVAFIAKKASDSSGLVAMVDLKNLRALAGRRFLAKRTYATLRNTHCLEFFNRKSVRVHEIPSSVAHCTFVRGQLGPVDLLSLLLYGAIACIARVVGSPLALKALTLQARLRAKVTGEVALHSLASTALFECARGVRVYQGYFHDSNPDAKCTGGPVRNEPA